MVRLQVVIALIASALAADPAGLGLPALPPEPASRSPDAPLVERARAIEAGEVRPEVLVPFNYAELGWAFAGPRWYDEEGHVYRSAEVMAILRQHPPSAQHLRRSQVAGAGFTVGTVAVASAAALTLSGPALLLVVPAAFVGLLVPVSVIEVRQLQAATVAWNTRDLDQVSL